MNLSKILKNPIFKKISEIADSSKLECFVVGGFVRDSLLNRKKVKTDRYLRESIVVTAHARNLGMQ